MAVLPPPPPASSPPGPWPDRSRPHVDPAELRPARWWYGVAGVLVAVGIGAGLVIGALAIVDVFQLRGLDEFTTGRAVDFDLDPDEPRSIYVHQPEDTVPLVDCSGEAPEGAAIELVPTGREAAVFHGTELWVEEYEVEVSGAGTYSIECRGFEKLGELRLGLGPRSDPVAVVGRMNAASLLGTGATGAGVLVGLVVGLRRSSHKRRLIAERSRTVPGHGDPARRQGGAGDGGVAGHR